MSSRRESDHAFDPGSGLQPRGGKLDDITVVVYKVPSQHPASPTKATTKNKHIAGFKPVRDEELILNVAVDHVFGRNRRQKIAQKEVRNGVAIA